MWGEARNAAEMYVSGRLHFALFFRPGEKTFPAQFGLVVVFGFFSLFHIERIPVGEMMKAEESPSTKSAFSLPNLCVCLKKRRTKSTFSL